MSAMMADFMDADGAAAPAVAMDGVSIGRALAASVPAEERLALARAMVRATMQRYWEAVPTTWAERFPLRRLPCDVQLSTLPPRAANLASATGEAAAKLDPLEAGYLMGLLYTAMMPDRLRASLGAYYTPPALSARLLDLATAAGVDWSVARVLDPACGGGAFLAPVALRMAASAGNAEPKAVLEQIEQRLVGLEVDPFAGWMSQVFLDAALGGHCRAAGRRLGNVVRVCNSLEQAAGGLDFDLVVGNPPYGRTKLSPLLRRKFARSLFGHANLYGVFTDLALRLARKGGIVAFVTPTSFLSGEYFKALRGLLGEEAPPASIDFVEGRKGVFADVLQETLLATYKRGGDHRSGKVHFLSLAADGSVKTATAGSFHLPASPEKPWMMPRNERQGELLKRVGALSHRLADWGYTVSTGPLVWNRHKRGLRDRPGRRRYPLVWAESVRADGCFAFRAEKRNHRPFFEPDEGEQWVVTDFPCVLVQRTTAKEQCRRLIAAELPASFVEEHGAVVVENHLNMVKPRNGAPEVRPAALAAVLNSDLVDQLFRCINGSVAVSAYELGALPLPAAESVREIERLVQHDASRDELESAVARAYGCDAP